MITREKLPRIIRDPREIFRIAGRRLNGLRSRLDERRGISGPPLVMTLFLTYRCNLNCGMCPLHGSAGQFDGNAAGSFRKDIFFRVIDELAPLGTSFMLMGGEPTLPRDWLEVVERAKKHNSMCEIVTNGMYMARDAEKIVAGGLDMIKFSVDGLGSIHDKSRGVEGSFDRIAEGLRRVVEVKAERNSSTPRMVLLCTITQHNFNHLIELAEWAVGKGIDEIRYTHIRFFDQSDYDETMKMLPVEWPVESSPAHGFVFDPDFGDVGVLVDELRKLQAREWPFKLEIAPNYPLDELEAYYHDKRYRRREVTVCKAPWGGSCVSPDGKVLNCLYFPCGDLHEQSFMEIWNGPIMREFRRTMRKVKRLPVCHRCCV